MSDPTDFTPSVASASMQDAYSSHSSDHGAEFVASNVAHTSGPPDSTRVSIPGAYFNHHTGYSHGVEFVAFNTAHTSGPTDFTISVASASIKDAYSSHSSDYGVEFAASDVAHMSGQSDSTRVSIPGAYFNQHIGYSHGVEFVASDTAHTSSPTGFTPSVASAPMQDAYSSHFSDNGMEFAASDATHTSGPSDSTRVSIPGSYFNHHTRYTHVVEFLASNTVHTSDPTDFTPSVASASMPDAYSSHSSDHGAEFAASDVAHTRGSLDSARVSIPGAYFHYHTGYSHVVEFVASDTAHTSGLIDFTLSIASASMQDAYSRHSSDHGAEFAASDATHTSGTSDSARVSIPGAYFNHHTGYSHGVEFVIFDTAHMRGPTDFTPSVSSASMQDAFSSHSRYHGAEFAASDAAHTSGPSDSTRVSIPGAYFNQHTGYSHGVEFVPSDTAHTSSPTGFTPSVASTSMQDAYSSYSSDHGAEFAASDAAHTSDPSDSTRVSIPGTYFNHHTRYSHVVEFVASNTVHTSDPTDFTPSVASASMQDAYSSNSSDHGAEFAAFDVTHTSGPPDSTPMSIPGAYFNHHTGYSHGVEFVASDTAHTSFDSVPQ